MWRKKMPTPTIRKYARRAQRRKKQSTTQAQNIGQEYNVMYAMHNAYASMFVCECTFFLLAVGVYTFFLCCSAIFHSALIEKSMWILISAATMFVVLHSILNRFFFFLLPNVAWERWFFAFCTYFYRCWQALLRLVFLLVLLENPRLHIQLCKAHYRHRRCCCHSHIIFSPSSTQYTYAERFKLMHCYSTLFQLQRRKWRKKKYTQQSETTFWLGTHSLSSSSNTDTTFGKKHKGKK